MARILEMKQDKGHALEGDIVAIENDKHVFSKDDLVNCRVLEVPGCTKQELWVKLPIPPRRIFVISEVLDTYERQWWDEESGTWKKLEKPPYSWVSSSPLTIMDKTNLESTLTSQAVKDTVIAKFKNRIKDNPLNTAVMRIE